MGSYPQELAFALICLAPISFFKIVSSSITLSSDLNLNLPIAPDLEPFTSSAI